MFKEEEYTILLTFYKVWELFWKKVKITIDGKDYLQQLELLNIAKKTQIHFKFFKLEKKSHSNILQVGF